MSNINSVGQTPIVQHVYASKGAAKAEGTQSTAAPSSRDKVELSSTASAMLSKLKSAGDVRTDKVAQIKAEIEAGTYETDAKMDAAIDKMFDDLA